MINYEKYKNTNIWFLDHQLRFPKGIEFNIKESNATTNMTGVDIKSCEKDLSLDYFLLTRKVWEHRNEIKTVDKEYIDKLSKMAASNYISDLEASYDEDFVIEILDRINSNMNKYHLSCVLNSPNSEYSSIDQDVYPCGPMIDGVLK